MNKKKAGLLSVIKPVAIVLLLVLLYLSVCSSAKEGYQVNVRVSNSTGASIWSNGLTTETLAFQSQSEVSGTGNSSKYTRLSDIAGMNLNDAGYTKQGRLISNSTMSVASKLSYVHIQETVNENSTAYHGEINLSMPTVMYAAEELYYRGDGMNLRNSYTNGDDEIKIALSGTLVTKSVLFGSAFNTSRIYADVTPKSVLEKKFENRTTAFRILSSADRETKFRFKSEDKALLDQDYVGAFQLNTKLITGNVFHFDQEEDAWLPCCSDSTMVSSINRNDYVPSLVYLLGCEDCKIV